MSSSNRDTTESDRAQNENNPENPQKIDKDASVNQASAADEAEEIGISDGAAQGKNVRNLETCDSSSDEYTNTTDVSQVTTERDRTTEARHALTDSDPSTQARLRRIIDDMETVAEELISQMFLPTHERTEDTESLTKLLVEKDAELKEVLKLAEEQAELQRKINALQEKVARMDAETRKMQRALMEAEDILSTSIYQAKQKLAAIRQANKRPNALEDILRLARNIAGNAGDAAPKNWKPGDPRRPYPTAEEMMRGSLNPLNQAHTTATSSASVSTDDPGTAKSSTERAAAPEVKAKKRK
ncbi:hypothetical protein ACOMHN_017753 [Nucella lapillus]